MSRRRSPPISQANPRSNHHDINAARKPATASLHHRASLVAVPPLRYGCLDTTGESRGLLNKVVDVQGSTGKDA